MFLFWWAYIPLQFAILIQGGELGGWFEQE